MAVEVAKELGLEQKARDYLALGLRVNETVVGRDHPHYREMEEMATQIGLDGEGDEWVAAEDGAADGGAAEGGAAVSRYSPPPTFEDVEGEE
jgi:hypothetical protein